MAQRLAKIELLRARQQITVAMPMKLVGMKANVGDIVQINNTRMGWSSKPFEVVSANIAFGETVGVDIDLREVSTDVYDWATSEEQTYDPAPNTNLPSGFVSEPVGISITDTLAISAETIITQLVVTVTGSDVFEDRFEVQAKPSTSDNFLNLGQASGNIFQLANVIDGAIYNVRARAINVFGVRSDWTTDDHEVIGKTAPPENVTGLTGNLIGNQYLLTWNAVPDLDLSYYRVRYASPDSGGSYENSVSLVPKVSRPATSVFVPARNGTYFVKAVDKLGLASMTPASIALDTNIAAVESLNVIQIINEAPDFNGTFDDTVELDEDDALVLNTSVLFDAVSGDFDDASGLFDGGSGNVDAFGYYYFATDVDLGAIYISRCTAYVEHIRLDYVVLFDSAEGLFDARQRATLKAM